MCGYAGCREKLLLFTNIVFCTMVIIAGASESKMLTILLVALFVVCLVIIIVLVLCKRTRTRTKTGVVPIYF